MAKRCGLRHKTSSKCLQVFEGIMLKLVLIISICSIIYAKTWLTVVINFAFLTLALFSVITYGMCYRRKSPILVIPMQIYLSVCIFWITIWVYASFTAIMTGYLWSLEWLGGPQSSTAPISHDVKDDNYVNPNETSPETKKSIKFGTIIGIVSLVVLVFKITFWVVARNTFCELRQYQGQNGTENNCENFEEESDLGASSPSFPSVVRLPPSYETATRGDKSEVMPLRPPRSPQSPTNSHLESSI